MKKTLVAVAASALLGLPLGLAHATPPDNRPPADRGNSGNHSQSQQQQQQQGQCQALIIVLGSCAGGGALPGFPPQ